MRSPQAEPPPLLQNPEGFGNHRFRVLRIKVLDEIRTDHEVEAFRLQARVSGIRTEEGHAVDRRPGQPIFTQFDTPLTEVHPHDLPDPWAERPTKRAPPAAEIQNTLLRARFVNLEDFVHAVFLERAIEILEVFSPSLEVVAPIVELAPNPLLGHRAITA